MSCVGKRLCFVGEWEMLLLARGGRGSVGRADLSLKHRECRRPLSHGGGRVLEGGGGMHSPHPPPLRGRSRSEAAAVIPAL